MHVGADRLDLGRLLGVAQTTAGPRQHLLQRAAVAEERMARLAGGELRRSLRIAFRFVRGIAR